MLSEKIYLYDDRKDVYVTTYIRDDSPEMLKGVKRPTVLVLPGGAYLNCSDREAEPIALRFVAMGYQAVVLRYSVYLEGRPGFPDMSGKLEPNMKTVYPRPLREVAQTMLLLRENADKWCVDPDRVFLIGFSAGAHNAAMYATSWFKPVITDYFGRPEEDFKPAAAILAYPLADYSYAMSVEYGDPMVKMLMRLCTLAYFGTETPSAELLEECSPAKQVSGKTPPMFIWTTANDNLVPSQHTMLMANALADKKIPFEAHVFEDGPHGLALSDLATASNKEYMNADAAKWVPLCEEWLKKRFGVDMPDKVQW